MLFASVRLCELGRDRRRQLELRPIDAHDHPSVHDHPSQPVQERGRKMSTNRNIPDLNRGSSTDAARQIPEGLARLVEKEPARKKQSSGLGILHRFDKAFPVRIESAYGIANGVGRNIAPEGMFVETRVPCPLASEVRITFSAPDDTSIVAVGEVRFQSFLNFAGSTPGESEGLRGFGVRFLRFE